MHDLPAQFDPAPYGSTKEFRDLNLHNLHDLHYVQVVRRRPVTGLPLAWQVETARRNESLYAAPLLDAVRARGFKAQTVAMDRGYDNNRVYHECHARGVAPVIPLRKGRIQPATPIKRGTPQWADLYRRRTSVEREFGRLKHDYGLAFLRVRGIERIRLHADLIVLARLSQALSRARAVPVAA